MPIHVNTVWERPFCRLLHFERAFEYPPRRPQPRLLIVAPVSGHHATLLRGTVESMLPTHDVYVTDWIDAKLVPMSEGRFSLSDYVDYLISIFHRMGGNCHVMAVCQPAVPVMMAIARMEAEEDPFVPKLHGAHGRPHRHPRGPHRGEHAGPGPRHRMVPPQRHHHRALAASRAPCARSIRASCSSTASCP